MLANQIQDNTAIDVASRFAPRHAKVIQIDFSHLMLLQSLCSPTCRWQCSLQPFAELIATTLFFFRIRSTTSANVLKSMILHANYSILHFLEVLSLKYSMRTNRRLESRTSQRVGVCPSVFFRASLFRFRISFLIVSAHVYRTKSRHEKWQVIRYQTVDKVAKRSLTFRPAKICQASFVQKPRITDRKASPRSSRTHDPGGESGANDVHLAKES